MEEYNTSRFIPYDLIQNELDGIISAEERLLLEHWLSEDLENAKLYEEVKALLNDIMVLEQYKNVDTKRQWNRFKQRLYLVPDTDKGTLSTPITTSWKPWMKYAAAAVLLMIGYACYLNFGRLMGYEIHLYGTNAQKRVLLPDSSVMILYEGSEAVFNSRTFDQKRVVELKKGKAFFDVKHGLTSSFVVELENNYVRDIGTSFEVNLCAEDVEVLVIEGTVALSAGKGGAAKELILQKNEKGIFINETAILSKVTVHDLDSHDEVTKKFSYDNERVDNICLNLEQHFQSNILVIGDNLKARKLRLYVDGQSLHEIVPILAKTLNVKWKMSKRGYIIYE